GEEQRHIIGSRLWLQGPVADFELDGMYQWGNFGPGRISAWAVVVNAGVTRHAWRPAPRIGARVAAMSGDRDPADSTLGTFSPLFADPTYGGSTARLGPSNSVSVVPNLRLQLSPMVSLNAEWGLYWRQSVHDGVYSALGGVMRTGRFSVARFVGSQPALWLDWQINRHATVTFCYTHFFAGRFLKETPPGDDIDFVYLQLRYRF
ncbi:MAG: alginate export family protein, partial [Burkholderiales bacterium]|nr:alginate export family protein [Burkholderiales bacterium]